MPSSMHDPAASSSALIGNAASGPQLSRFHIVALTFQRARQLQGGARPRVEAPGHKPPRLALLEVMADTVSWTVS